MTCGMSESLPKSPESIFSPDDDARTVARAHEVRKDRKRFKALQDHVRGLHAAVFTEAERPTRKGRKRRSARNRQKARG